MMRIDEDQARRLTGRGGDMDAEMIRREARDEAGQVIGELHRLYDRVAELETEAANARTGFEACLRLANAAELRAGAAADRAALLEACERRAYEEARACLA